MASIRHSKMHVALKGIVTKYEHEYLRRLADPTPFPSEVGDFEYHYMDDKHNLDDKHHFTPGVLSSIKKIRDRKHPLYRCADRTYLGNRLSPSSWPIDSQNRWRDRTELESNPATSQRARSQKEGFPKPGWGDPRAGGLFYPGRTLEPGVDLLRPVQGIGEHFKPGATRPSSQFPSPVRFAFPDTSERRSPGVDH